MKWNIKNLLLLKTESLEVEDEEGLTAMSPSIMMDLKYFSLESEIFSVVTIWWLSPHPHYVEEDHEEEEENVAVVDDEHLVQSQCWLRRGGNQTYSLTEGDNTSKLSWAAPDTTQLSEAGEAQIRLTALYRSGNVWASPDQLEVTETGPSGLTH